MSYISKWRLQNNSVVPVGSNLFGTCNSSSSDTTKVVSLSAFNVLVEGVTIHVYFANANSGSNTLLQVGSTSAQPIKRNGVAEGKWESGSVISFTYSEGYWVQNDADVGGGVAETYTLSKIGNIIELAGSGGDTSSVIDDNTTYAIAVDGYQIVLTDSDGYSQRVTLPSGMFIVDDSNTLDEICGAHNDDRVIYYQYWENVSTLRLLPLAEIDCSDHALFAQIINDGTDTYLLIAMVDENDDWSTSAIPIETTDTTYTLSISGNTLTLTPSSGTAQSITLPDENTTYTLSISGDVLTLTDSDNVSQTVTIPDDDTTYSLSISGHTITLTGSDGSTDSVTVPDDDTTYGITISGHVITLTGSDGNTSAVTVPDDNTTYTISVSGNTLTLTPSVGTPQTITLPIPTKTSDLINDSDFVSDANYIHTDNNFTTAEKNKLSGIEAGAEVNVQANWNEADSTSDAYIQNKPTIPTPPSPSSTTPLMDGTASVGSEANYARGDHVHPSDTSKQDALVSGTNIKTINGNSVLGSGDLAVGGSVTSTDVPTPDTISEFDSDAHMNSTDMTSSQVDDFVDDLNFTGSGFNLQLTSVSAKMTRFTNVSGGYYKCGNLVIVQVHCYVNETFSANDYWTALGTFPLPATTNIPLTVSFSADARASGASAVINASGDMKIQSGAIALTNYTLYINGVYICTT